MASVSHSPSVLGMDLVTLVDRGGEEHSFGITAVEAGFPQRFRDLLNQCLVLCKVRYWVVSAVSFTVRLERALCFLVCKATRER